nr:putative disease resistance RPP13-like protein 1 [Ziziphus jujuba var. spinosa]
MADIDAECQNRLKMWSENHNKKDALDLKVKKGVASPTEPTTSLAKKSKDYGRYDDKVALLKRLLNEDEGRRIAIVGMRGAGKTTLAQYLYDHCKVKKCFKLRSWVYISGRFDISVATKAVLTAVIDPPSHSSYDNKDLDWLQTRLQEVLKGKKVLLVLDDVWDEIWEHMSKPFTHVARGSKFLIKMRDEEVAKRMGANKTYHHLNNLKKKYCLKLFEKHAFGGDKDSSSVANILKRIVQKFTRNAEDCP